MLGAHHGWTELSYFAFYSSPSASLNEKATVFLELQIINLYKRGPTAVNIKSSGSARRVQT